MTKKISFIVGFTVIIITLLFSGRFLGNSTNPTATPSVLHGGTASVATTRDGAKSAPDFTLQKIDGGTITLSEFKNEKPVILDFWASWCPNCRRDMPNLNRWYNEYKDQVEVIGINLQESPQTVKKFIDEKNISFPIALDPFGAVSRNYGTRYTNTHVLINTDGTIARTISGDIQERDILTLIESN